MYKLTYKFQKKDERDYMYISKLTYDLLSKEQAIQPVISPLCKKSIICDKLALPASFSLESSLSSILDQGYIGSCVSNAFSLCVSTMTKNTINLSRLFLYALARILENTQIRNDSGMYIRDGCIVIQNYGVCKESIYPYVLINYSLLPSLNAFKNSNLFTNFTYTAVNQDLNSLKQCLNVNNVPIVFGFIVYSSFMTPAVAKTGIVPMPNTTSEKIAGGHCMLLIGYDDANQWFICANSWGTSWGNKGICYLPYNYLTNSKLASDFIFLSFKY